MFISLSCTHSLFSLSLSLSLSLTHTPTHTPCRSILGTSPLPPYLFVGVIILSLDFLSIVIAIRKVVKQTCQFWSFLLLKTHFASVKNDESFLLRSRGTIPVSLLDRCWHLLLPQGSTNCNTHFWYQQWSIVWSDVEIKRVPILP